MNRMAAGAIALVLVIPLAGCGPSRLLGEPCGPSNLVTETRWLCKTDRPVCRWASEDGLIRTERGYCSAKVPGEYILSLGPGTKVDIINALYGQYGIQRIKEVKEWDGKGFYYLVTLTNDPGDFKMAEIAWSVSGFFSGTYVNVTPNYVYGRKRNESIR